VINEGDNIDDVVDIFTFKHNLNYKKKTKLRKVIDKQLKGHLYSIEEEDF